MNRPLKRFLSLSSVSLLLGSQTLLPSQPAQAQTSLGANGCPAGTIESPSTNLVANSTFTISPGAVGPLAPNNPASFTSTTPYRGDGVYPSDDVGGLSIQNGPLTDPTTPAVVNGRGVTAAEALQANVGNTPINTYLYSNPNASALTPGVPQSAFPNPIVWRQTVTNLTPNTTYNFKGLFFNLLVNTGAPGSNGVPPQIRLQVSTDGTGTTFIQPTTTLNVGDGSAVPGFPTIANTRQAWIPTQFAFTTGPAQTTAIVQILDEANNTFGDDFGFTALSIRQCVPNTPPLGVAKQAGTPTQNADGTYTIPYTITVRNLGQAGLSPQLDLFNLQLTDNLAQTFAAATLNSVTNIQSATLAENTGFNGSSNQNLLLGTDTLAAGATATITFSVNITPGTGANGFGPFNNTTTATATNQLGSPVRDQSNDGGNVDPDNDGNPGNNNTPTTVSLRPGGPTGSGAFRLIKRITSVVRNGTVLGGVNFSSFVDGAGDDDNAAGFSQLQPGNAPIGQINLDPTTTKLQSGDDVEYSVYYLSDGTGAAIGVSICDPIPLGTSLIANSAQLRRNNGAISTAGTVFAPLAPLPAGNTCPDANNQNGTLIFDLGDIPNTAGSNFGLVRFRVRVN
ncbi:MAG: hypothetical protein KME27_05505 [Lyngbya sp. HA4199-MV5]|nr:hypothetical protein [Lyngbya sp. HA4199-MV5]